jgi:cytochrome c-type biogenesis protein CcmH/NrfF
MENQEIEEKNIKASKKRYIKKFMKKSIPLSMALLITLNSTIGVAFIQHFFYMRQIDQLLTYKENLNDEYASNPEEQIGRLQTEVLPEEGVVLPVKWGDVGKRLVDIGVIDKDKFMELFQGGPLSSKNNNYDDILSGNVNENIVLTQENSRFVLNTLWGLGLAQQSMVLDDMKAEYPDVGNLAATGGWTIGKSDGMDYYGQHNIFNLSAKQQEQVKSIAQNIYRPCCNNHTAFADCNHGMAMLGLIEMMVAEGYSEDEIYDNALAVNSVWFPDTYLTIAKYMEDKQDIAWADVDSKEVLGKDFSSGSGYRGVLAQVNPVQSSGGGGGCGV